MKVALLSLYKFEEVRGGTEMFDEHLKTVFPDLTLITYSDARRTGLDLGLDHLNLEEPRKGLAIGRRFREIMKREDFDLVISNSIAGWWLSVLTPGIPMVNIFHFTLIGLAEQTLRSTPGYIPSRYFSPFFEMVAAHGKRCVAVSHKTRRELMDHYGVRSSVIEHGVPMDRFRPMRQDEAREALGIKWDGPLGIFVGRPDNTKGFDVVKKVAAMRPDVRFLCVTSADMNGNCITRKNVPNENMPVHYAAADFLLFPSRYESVGYTALEAMACDKPVIVSRTGVFEDLDEEAVGRIVPTFDAKDYSDAIDEVLDGPAVHPREVIAKRFSMDRFANDYRRMAADIVAEGEGPRPRQEDWAPYET